MTYQEAIQFLFCQTANYEKQGTSGYKPGLGTMVALDEHYGHPHRQFRCIHVGGTNGKGSVSHTLAAQLQVCGYRVGLYTSPHLVDFRERIRIDGHPISEDYVAHFVDQGRDFFSSIGATFFEITTAMAFKYFSESDVDIAVVEVGLGGRLDSTNIITPILSVITNISLDHTQLLGTTEEQIAMEKAGIIKQGIPCVIGEASATVRQVFSSVAQDVGAPIVFAEDENAIVSATPLPAGGGMEYKTIFGADFRGELAGLCQVKNTNTILNAFNELRKAGYLSDSDSSNNLRHITEEMELAFMNVTRLTGLQGRWQTVRDNPKVVCDTGHNVGAWEYLGRQLENIPCHELRIVYGILEDKDIYAVMSKLPKKARYYWTKGSTPRAFPETSLKIFGEQFELRGDSYPTVAKAYNAAMEGVQSDDFIFVGGSTYVVADFLKTLV